MSMLFVESVWLSNAAVVISYDAEENFVIDVLKRYWAVGEDFMKWLPYDYQSNCILYFGR